MSRIDDLIRDLCPDGVEFHPIGEFAELVRGHGMPKSTFQDSGVNCIHYGHIYTRYGVSTSHAATCVNRDYATTLTTVNPGDLVVANTSENLEDVGTAVAWLGNENAVTGGHATVIRSNQNPKYLSHYFRTPSFSNDKRRHAFGTKVIELSAKNLARIPVPLPPLEVQNEIARILDKFTELEAELEAELDVRKQQYSHYLNHFFTSNANTRMRTLRDVGLVRMCKRITKNQTSQQGDVPFYKIRTFGGTADAYISRELYNEYKEKYHFPKPGSILISAAGTIGRAVPYDGKDAYFQDSNIVWIENDETLVLNNYLFYFYKVAKWKTDDGTIKRLYNDRLLNTTIPVPPLPEQHRIVDCLDKFDTLVNDLTSGLPAEIEARRRQYEYYRDRLLTFPEKK